MRVEDQIDVTLLSERLLSTLALVFAAVALGLAAIGVYGVLSYSITQRRPEFGLRLALGASAGRIAGGVLRQVLRDVAIGMAIGLPPAVAAARMGQGLLFGVRVSDPANYVVSATLLAAIACGAAMLPARRACAIDPAETLRA